MLLLATAVLPLLLTFLLVGVRRPLHFLLPLYAVVVPFGSGLAPPGLPPSYFSASSLVAAILTVALVARLFTSRRGPTTIPPTVVVWLLFTAVAGATIHWTISAT
jgi:hypothetical protein